jgi:hypothetical protein
MELEDEAVISRRFILLKGGGSLCYFAKRSEAKEWSNTHY